MKETVTGKIKLLWKYNTLLAKYEALAEDVKNDCFNKLIQKLGEPMEIKRLREENKRLRYKVKELKKNQKK